MFTTFNELAEAELNDGIRYYENEQPGLGAAFLADVQRCSAGILEFPEAGRVAQGSIRRRLCERFRTRCCTTFAATKSGFLQ